MTKQQAIRTGRGRRSPRPAPRALPFAGGRGRPGTSSGRFGGLRAGRGHPARRGKQPSGNSALALARGVFGALGKNKTSTPRKGSRRGPALLAVLGGLGAAGAAAFKRRQSTQNQAQPTPDVEQRTETAPPASA